MRPWMPALVVMLAAVSATAQPAPVAARARVAVVIDLSANLSVARASELGSALADALQRELDVETLGGDDVERRLPPGGVPEGCIADRACIADLGARLDASELLLLSVVELDGDVRIDATWIAVATGLAVARPRIDLDDDTRAGEVFAAAAPRLLPDAPRRATEHGGGPPTTPGPRRHLTAGSAVAGGVAVAALAGGVGFGLSARASYDRCERDPDGCDGAARDGIGTRALVADLLVAGAVVGAATAAILYLRSADHGEAQPLAQRWIVTPTRHGALAELRVRF